MYKVIITIIVINLLGSCAFDKQFLNPYKLTTEDSYSDYVKEVNDSVTMTFKEDQTPILKDSEGKIAPLSYEIENI
ncbi:MAG: hypothetical protein ACPGVI_07615, partial [Crocinitomicaceae bacterium]